MNMKVKGENFRALKELIDTYRDNSRDLSLKRVYCEKNCANGFSSFCWSILWRSMSYSEIPTQYGKAASPEILRDLYDQGINDNHIETALKTILKDHKESKVI